MKTAIHPRSRRRGALTALAAGTAALALALAGCATAAEEPAGDDTNGSDAGDNGGLFDQALHDLLPESIQKSGAISFGGLWETPPTLSVDESDPTKPKGLAPEMAALFGEVLGVDVEWQNLAWPAQIPGLQAGSVDVLFGQVSISEEREKSVLDLIPFQRRAHALLVEAGNSNDISRIADMCGMTIAVPIGSNQSLAVAAVDEESCSGAGKPAIKTAEYQGAAAAVQALRAGTIEAWLDVEANVRATVKANEDVFAAVVVPEDEMPTEFSGIAISKENPGLSEAILGAMKAIIESGDYQALYTDSDLESSIVTIDDMKINPLTGTAVGEMAG